MTPLLPGSLALLGGLTALRAAYGYNRLVRGREQARAAWSDVEVQLARRHALVPPLVEAVARLAAQERGVAERAAALRGKARALRGQAERGEAEARLGAELERLVGLAEAYPELRADQAFADLMLERVRVADDLEAARRFYNGSARDHNDRVESVPDRWIARAAGFEAAEFFDAAEPAFEAGARIIEADSSTEPSGIAETQEDRS